MENELKVLFYLKRAETDETGFCPVMGNIRLNGTVAQFNSKIRAKAELWDSRTGRLIGKHKHATDANARLNKLNLAINNTFTELIKKKGITTAKEVKELFQGMITDMRKKLSKTYRVNIDMRWSKDIVVKATSAAEAKRKAWDIFKKRPARNLFGLLADRE